MAACEWSGLDFHGLGSFLVQTSARRHFRGATAFGLYFWCIGQQLAPCVLGANLGLSGDVQDFADLGVPTGKLGNPLRECFAGCWQ